MTACQVDKALFLFAFIRVIRGLIALSGRIGRGARPGILRDERGGSAGAPSAPDVARGRVPPRGGPPGGAAEHGRRAGADRRARRKGNVDMITSY